MYISLFFFTLINPFIFVDFLNYFIKDNSKFTFIKYFIAFTIYNGFIGWLFFFLLYLGLINYIVIFIIFFLFFCFSLNVIYKKKYYKYISFSLFKSSSTLLNFLFFFIFIIFLGEFFESISPLTNADTLAYHLPIPFELIENNRLVVPERALTGYQPLLTHLSFIPYIMFGGESLLRIYFFICQLLLFISLAEYFSTKLTKLLALMASIMVITIPVYIYSAGNGNIEIINLMQVLSLLYYFDIKQTKDKSTFVPAILVGLYASSKFFGLFLFLAYLSYLILLKFNLKKIFIFSIIFILTSFQWYFFIFLETGTPFFPVLFDYIGFNNLSFWNLEQQQYFKDNISQLDQNFFFKFISIFIYLINFLIPSIKAGGLQLSYGPIFIFAITPLILTIFKKPSKFSLKKIIIKNEFMIIAIFFYFYWYFFGSVQYLRYLFPVLIPIIILTIRWYFIYLNKNKFLLTLYTSILVTILFQSSLFFVNNYNYFKYVFTGESINEFYSRNVPYYDAIKWVNENVNLTNQYILSDIRSFRYLSKNKILVIQPLLQNKINISTNILDSGLFLREIIRENIKIIILKDGNLENINSGIKDSSSFNNHINYLYDNNCLILVKNLIVNDFGSRAINSFKGKKENFIIKIFKLNKKDCSLLHD